MFKHLKHDAKHTYIDYIEDMYHANTSLKYNKHTTASSV